MEIGCFLGVRFTEFLKVLEVSFVTQVAALYFKIALYGLTREHLKDTVMYGFDLCGRNEVRVTALKSWGRVTSISHLAGCSDLTVLRNPKEGNLRRSRLCKCQVIIPHYKVHIKILSALQRVFLKNWLRQRASLEKKKKPPTCWWDKNKINRLSWWV